MANAPTVGGVMELTEEDITQIKDKLVLIREAFVATDEQPVCDTFYLTSTYNKTNTFKINGDTAQYVLGYVNEGEV